MLEGDCEGGEAKHRDASPLKREEIEMITMIMGKQTVTAWKEG